MLQSIFCKLCFITFLIFAVAANIPAQTSFEGKVVMNVKSDDESTEIDFFVKGNKTLIQVDQEEKASMIMDSKGKKMLLIMPEQKMYMEMDLNIMKDYASQMTNKDNVKTNDGTTDNFKMTGETKKINGYECEKWVYSDDDGGKTEAWMTKALGNFMGFSNPMMGNEENSWQKKIEGQGYFPMLAIHYDDSGDVESSMEVKSAEEKSLDDSMFEVPSGFRKFDIPMMNKGQN